MTSKIMPTYNRKPVTFVRGDGVYLYDSDGKMYLDALCGLAVTSLGHSHPLIAETIKKQSEKLIHTSNAFNIESQEKLAKKDYVNLLEWKMHSFATRAQKLLRLQ